MTHPVPNQEAQTLANEEPADVVIVGGGPIGYAQAWGFKKLNPKLQVVVLEKYDEFKRKHTLVMHSKQLDNLMKATGAEAEPRLVALREQLKKNPHIRTNVLQQIFKELAEDLEVRTIQETVKEETIKQQVGRFQPKLVVGADGTHSVVSKKLFPPKNQIRYEVDFALQLRFEINGNEEQSWEQIVSFQQRLARNGLVATEQVGRVDEHGKAPVTLQIIIPKKDYESLREIATASAPITPFAGTQNNRQVPEYLKNFINEYLAERIKLLPKKAKIDPKSVSISVNELPAIKARHVVAQNDAYFVSLNGDAGLALSYFIGLKAGHEALAHYFTLMKASIENGLVDKSLIKQAFYNYQQWFSPFAAKKVEKVKQFSVFRVKSATRLLKITRSIKGFSRPAPPITQENVINTYFHFLNSGTNGDYLIWNPYPHRSYDPNIILGQFSYVPLSYSFKKIGKLFVDFFKPYKGIYQVKQDFKQPVIGLINVAIGLIKIIAGLASLNIYRVGDGFLCLIHGAVALGTTPLTWFLKPITRGLITWFSPPKKIETNQGIQKLIRMGERLLDEEDDTFSVIREKELLGICNDLHRKYHKSLRLGECTEINADEEIKQMEQLTEDQKTSVSRQHIASYFNLFSKKKPVLENTASPNEVDLEQELKINLS